MEYFRSKNENDQSEPETLEKSSTSAYHEVNVVQLQQQKDKGKIVKTPCEHSFHLLCLNLWFKSREICPYCRKDLGEVANVLNMD